MTRRSKIDMLGIGDQVLLWAMTKDTRSIARDANEEYKSKMQELDMRLLSHNDIARWLVRQSETKPAIAEAKVEAVIRVTKDLLESKWAWGAAEIDRQYHEAVKREDERGAAEWFSKFQKHIEMILRLYRPPETIVTVDARQTGGEGLKERLWNLVNAD